MWTTYKQRRRALLWTLFARTNPVLPPRRRARTAKSWASAADVVARRIGSFSPEWAARVVLDAGSKIETPPGIIPEDLPGSLRSHARDRGGIGGAVLITAARAVLGTLSTPSEEEWAAWSILFPNTASLGCGFLKDTEAAASAAVSEWEEYGREEFSSLRDYLPTESGGVAEYLDEVGLAEGLPNLALAASATGLANWAASEVRDYLGEEGGPTPDSLSWAFQKAALLGNTSPLAKMLAY